MIISFLNEKGGVGKSTLTLNIAAYFYHQLNLKVLLVDTDRQGTLRDWQTLSSSDIDLVTLDTPKAIKSLPNLTSKYDLICLDGAGKAGLDGVSVEAIKVSDLVIIPLQVGSFDMWGSESVVEACKIRRELCGKPDCRFVFNRVNSQTKIFAEGKKILEHYEIETFEHYVSQRVAFASLASTGESVMSKGDPKAYIEIKGLANEIVKIHPFFVNKENNQPEEIK